MSKHEIWLRWGRIVAEPLETKFNPWHDPENGQFTFAGAGNSSGGGNSAPRKTSTIKPSSNWRLGGRMSPKQVEQRAANAMRMYKIHLARGMTPEQAAGWAANAEAESGGDYRSVQPKKGPGRGLFQVGDGYREKLFEQRYGHSIERSTEAEQLDFRDWELIHNESGAGKKIAKAKSAGDIAAAITLDYLRPRKKYRDAADRANIAEAILRHARKGP